MRPHLVALCHQHPHQQIHPQTLKHPSPQVGFATPTTQLLYTEDEGPPSDLEVLAAAVILRYGAPEFGGINGEISRGDWVNQVILESDGQLDADWSPPPEWSRGKGFKGKLWHTYEDWLNCRDALTLNEVCAALGELGHHGYTREQIK